MKNCESIPTVEKAYDANKQKNQLNSTWYLMILIWIIQITTQLFYNKLYEKPNCETLFSRTMVLPYRNTRNWKKWIIHSTNKMQLITDKHVCMVQWGGLTACSSSWMKLREKKLFLPVNTHFTHNLYPLRQLQPSLSQTKLFKKRASSNVNLRIKKPDSKG